jgi:hypothetical protein
LLEEEAKEPPHKGHVPENKEMPLSPRLAKWVRYFATASFIVGDSIVS